MPPTGKKQQRPQGKDRTMYDEIEDSHNLPVGITDIKSAIAAELNKPTSASATGSDTKFKITEHTIPRNLPPEYKKGGRRGAATGLSNDPPKEGTLLSKVAQKQEAKGAAANNEDDDDDDWEISDLWQAFFLTIPLELVVILFDVLVYMQYRDSIVYSEIAERAVKAFPPLWLMIYLTHPRNSHPAVQVGFLLAAIAGGCWAVNMVNTEGVFAYIKKVPPVGALLVWCIIEMSLLPALIACAAIGGYTWWNGFSLM